MIYPCKEIRLGITPLQSDRDFSRLVDERLPLASVDSLSNHGMTDEEIYSLIVPRRTLAHRKPAAGLGATTNPTVPFGFVVSPPWPKRSLEPMPKLAGGCVSPRLDLTGGPHLICCGRRPGARLVEEMLLQLGYGFAA